MENKPEISVLRKVPLKILNITSQGNHQEIMKTVLLTSVAHQGGCDSPSQHRKRQRLDHLTVEEKLIRRKLKNRVAAQSARDRKKYHMQDLETHVKHLADDNQRLMEENKKLQESLKDLLQENIQLKKSKLNLQPSVTIKTEDRTDCDQKVSISSPPCEPAVFTTTSLQQRWADMMRVLLVCNWIGTSLGSALWMMPYLTWTTAALLLTGKKYSMSSSRSWSKDLDNQELDRIIQKLGPPSTWWGPQQQSWNPSKNALGMTTIIPRGRMMSGLQSS